MPRKARTVSGQAAIRALEHLGFKRLRQKGSHVILRKGNRGCVVPLHAELALGTLHSILRQAGVSEDEFFKAIQ